MTSEKQQSFFTLKHQYFMIKNEINFEMLPIAVSQILTEMAEIKKMLGRPVREPIFKEKISFKEALDLLSKNGYNISESKLYKLTSCKKIPHGKINNKLIFHRDELIHWIENQIITNPNLEHNSIINSAIALSKTKYKNGKK